MFDGLHMHAHALILSSISSKNATNSSRFMIDSRPRLIDEIKGLIFKHCLILHVPLNIGVLA